MSRKARKKEKWIVGGVVIAAAMIGMSLLNLGKYAVYFYTPSEAVLKASDLHQQDIKVGGMVKGGSVQWKPETLSLKFVLNDMENTEILVQHHGTPPDMFKENSGVVVEGKIGKDGKSFTAKSLMVKHSEEYKIPGDHRSVDKELLERSIFKDQ